MEVSLPTPLFPRRSKQTHRIPSDKPLKKKNIITHAGTHRTAPRNEQEYARKHKCALSVGTGELLLANPVYIAKMFHFLIHFDEEIAFIDDCVALLFSYFGLLRTDLARVN